MREYTVEQAAMTLGVGKSAIYMMMQKGKLKYELAPSMANSGRRVAIISGKSISSILVMHKAKQDAWENVVELNDRGMGYVEIGKLVKPETKWHYQTGYQAVTSGRIEDVDGFKKRLKGLKK